MKNKIIFNFLLILLLIVSMKSELRIPFKTKIFSNFPQKIVTQEDLQNVLINLIHNDIYIELDVGMPLQQRIESFLKLEEFPFFIQGKDIPSSKYNQTKSTTYKSELYPHVFVEGEEQIKWGYVSNETIEIKNLANKLSIEKFNFILVTETKTDSPSNIGLMIPNQYTSIPDISFIIQLKKQNLIDLYSFVLNYTSYEKGEGEFIIGGPPHFYDNKYNDKYYTSENAIPKPKYMMYGLAFDSINYGNNKTNIGGIMQSKFLSDFGLIIGSNNYYEIIYEKFFRENIENKICYKNEIKVNIEWREGVKNFEYFYCDKNKVDISKLENLKFIHNKMNYTFEFNYTELFYVFDNYYIFKILFSKGSNFYWIFGKPWLAKYLMVFDQDSKTIGHYFYVDYDLNDNNNKIYDKDNNKINIDLIVIIVCLILIFFGLGIIFFRLYFRIGRRRRHNEINDGYEYNEENNNQNRLINEN